MPVEEGGGGSTSGGSPSPAPRRRPTATPNTPRGTTASNSGPITGGSVADAFGASVGAVPGSVKMSYVGKDAHGNSIYKFTFKKQGIRGPAVSLTRTYAVTRSSGGGWNFGAPGKPGEIPNTDQVRFGESSASRTELISRAVGVLGDMLERGIITHEEARTDYNFSTWSDQALTSFISRGGTRVPHFPRNITEIGQQAPLGSDGLFADLGPGGGGGFGYGGGGGGGGGGIIEPAYMAPDRRVVEDFVKGSLVSMVGGVPEHLIGPGVELYMRDHRANFDQEVGLQVHNKPGKEIDPQMSVLEYIRSTKEYQTIHKLRPKSVDERQWISDRAEQAVQGGIANVRQEDFAITQATAGADIQDVAEAAATAEFKATGQAPALLENQFRQVAQAMFSRVAR